MQQNFNSYPRQPSQFTPSSYMPPIQSGLKGRPVASFDEARASTIDFDGSIFYFPDIANKRIYTKQINMDGSLAFNMYELKEFPNNEVTVFSNNNYITREEFESAIQQLKNTLTQPTKEIKNF